MVDENSDLEVVLRGKIKPVIFPNKTLFAIHGTLVEQKHIQLSTKKIIRLTGRYLSSKAKLSLDFKAISKNFKLDRKLSILE